ncbi:hypothetical protein JQ557_02140 [Bradyrhizobium sp. U87765 SZCCT0131]|uniref:hypothetical protein n=1 Tax=unclassified Bradyrhizobium TaxID=2631580 RepID=UPI001BA4CBD4|nr:MULTISPECIES: hypothetical protein [unclassified Bradyrhizobium]MBR1216774.1 hypothetical protein [Bradyrhizobium sp. U87765 SZCCT0131]MBR1259470.1 hypothetical protein [Bradyrhizobium sp. U87765 SZCCT0134]MBR1305611.1 hypothetical protein [Bradyrhizobium sp. U87765 SZCCT0110]MBR1321978.1 hypothetical protein [Bradyrhizobium sp. U87765 SZCCT0109]MBR1350744.1 hypothetical protein [Bradyrhizobium sp. U87765 SZCCT0048]
MRILRPFAFVLATFAMLSPALAADPTFPKGTRVGLVPLEGLTPAASFPGFEATDQRVKVVVTELPRDAFDSIDAAFKANQTGGSRPKLEPFELESGNKAYITRETATEEGASVRRFSVIIAGPAFSGYVAAQVPDTDKAAYSDDAVRRMLASVALRKNVPAEEQLDRLPFKMSELGGFKTMRTIPAGTTVLLTDAEDDQSSVDTAAYMLIGVMGSGPATPDDRGRFAQQIIAALPGLREARITSSEPLRIEGSPGYETRLEAVTGKDNTPVTVIQWLRFGGGNTTLRIVASAKRDEWPAAFPRFRAVRDGIGSR